MALYAAAGPQAQAPPLPNRPNSLKFAAIGDNGTGDTPQYEVGAQMAKLHASFPFDLVIMLGDNMYGGQSPSDYVKKFERPYAPLLAAGVKFQASIGNHDQPAQVSYNLYNMNGQRYYSYARNNVRFFALDSNRMDPKQVEWLEAGLKSATRGLEDLLLPSPALFERRATWRGGRSACENRAVVRQVRR